MTFSAKLLFNSDLKCLVLHWSLGSYRYRIQNQAFLSFFMFFVGKYAVAGINSQHFALSYLLKAVMSLQRVRKYFVLNMINGLFIIEIYRIVLLFYIMT